MFVAARHAARHTSMSVMLPETAPVCKQNLNIPDQAAQSTRCAVASDARVVYIGAHGVMERDVDEAKR